MKSFYIVTNTTKDPDLVYTNSILDYLNKHNVSCIYNPDSADVEHTDYCYTNADIVPDVYASSSSDEVCPCVPHACGFPLILPVSAPLRQTPGERIARQN